MKRDFIPGTTEREVAPNIVFRPIPHRIYWNKETGKSISAFLSYPGAMAIGDRYFWEIHPYEDDVARFDSEDEMERAVVAELSKP